MNETEQAKQLIREAKNIYIIPPQNNEPESIANALALFYTLKELNKNVNLIVENFPENLKFLTPSLDFISYPKNFVISIPNKIAGVSQIYYEKNDDALKIHLTIENGSVKKDDISFYFSETKPDLIITLGIKDYQSQLQNRLNSFGFLLDSPILNIDNSQDNRNFGKINLINSLSITETVLDLIKKINQDSIKKETATCLLAGLMAYTNNFKNPSVTADIFEAAGYLMKKGANMQEISKNIV